MWGVEPRGADPREGLRRTEGIAGDAGAVHGPWGFQASELTCPVAIWHGNDDRVCPQFVGRWFADVIPGARLYALPKAGHVAIYGYSLSREVVDWLLATSAVPGAQTN